MYMSELLTPPGIGEGEHKDTQNERHTDINNEIIIAEIGNDHEEVDFYSAKNSELNHRTVDEGIDSLYETVNQLIKERSSPSVTGQTIIHALTRIRLSFAADLPHRDYIYPEGGSDRGAEDVVQYLNSFEMKTRELLTEYRDELFRDEPDKNIDEFIDQFIDGALAEEVAMRLVSQVSPNARIFYPNEEDEHNGVDFFVVGEERALAVQVKVARYKVDDDIPPPPILHIIRDKNEMHRIIQKYASDDKLTNPNTAYKLRGKMTDSLSASLDYMAGHDPENKIDSALMPISSDMLNPRLDGADIDRLEAENALQSLD